MSVSSSSKNIKKSLQIHRRINLDALVRTGVRCWSAKSAQWGLIDKNETGHWMFSRFDQSFLKKVTTETHAKHWQVTGMKKPDSRRSRARVCREEKAESTMGPVRAGDG
jgi:hypothetical protein